ncbi:hypothetical protein ACK3Y2_19150 [Aeromonas caviae]
MSQLHINTPILNNADLDRFVDMLVVKLEARITANQQKRDIQSQITKAVSDALAKQNKPTQKPIAEEEDIFANYKIEG